MPSWLVKAAQKAKGRRALKYEIEVVPSFVGEIPDGVPKVLFCWSRGQKLYVTDAVTVSTKTRAAFFNQYLRQVTTIYMEGNEIIPKEYTFKIQTPGAKEDDRHTIGKVKIDLAQFCDGQENPEAQEVSLQCKPVGKVKVNIKARWLKDARIDPDAMTEMTEMTDYPDASMPSGSQRRKSKHKKYADDEQGPDEQDLSGFDPVSEDGQQGGEGEPGTGSQQRSKKKGRRRRQMEQEIPEGFEVPVDAEQAAQAAEAGELVMGCRAHKKGWRDYVCCCLEPAVAEAEIQAVELELEQEGATLLSDNQAAAMDIHNDSTPVEYKKPRKKKPQQQQQQQGGSQGGSPAEGTPPGGGRVRYG